MTPLGTLLFDPLFETGSRLWHLFCLKNRLWLVFGNVHHQANHCQLVGDPVCVLPSTHKCNRCNTGPFRALVLFVIVEWFEKVFHWVLVSLLHWAVAMYDVCVSGFFAVFAFFDRSMFIQPLACTYKNHYGMPFDVLAIQLRWSLSASLYIFI